MPIEVRKGISGDTVSGPAGSVTDNTITRFDGTTGDLIQDSDLIIEDSGNLDHKTNGATITIGATNASTITIGRSGATVNILGNTKFEQVTETQIKDKLITINKGGATSSASETGIEFEENASVTGYIKTSTDRNSFELKAPNTSGVATITPGAAGLTIDDTIVKSSTASVTDNQIARFDSTTGKLIQASGVTIDDSDNIVTTGNVSGAALNGTSSTITGTINTQTLEVKDTSLVLDQDDVNTTTIQKDGTQASAISLTLPKITDTIAGIASTQTFTNKTHTSPVLNGTISGDAFLDEDNMASDSATKLASQQSIKAYADTKLADSAGNGILARTSAATTTNRTITGTSNTIDVTNGDGVSGNPTIDLADNPIIGGTDSVTVPVGTTAQRNGTPTNGMIRYNSTLNRYEGYGNSTWNAITGADPFLGLQNFETLGDYEQITTGDFSTGNNATFDGGGVLGGTFSISTTAADLIQGGQIAKYTGSATAGNNTNDYIARDPIDIPQGYRGRLLGFKFQYRTSNYTSGNIAIRVKDTTNGDILTLDTYTLDAYEDATNNTATEGAIAFYCPDDCTQIEYGFQVLTGEASTTLVWDDVLITPSPFVIAEFNINTEWEAFTPTGTFTNTTYTGYWRRIGDSMQIDYYLKMTGSPASATLDLDIPLSLEMDTDKLDTSLHANYGIQVGTCIGRNSGSATYGTGPVYYSSTTTVRPGFNDNGQHASNTVPHSWKNGDHLHARVLVPIKNWSIYSEKVVTYNPKEAESSMVRVHTSNGYGSTNTHIKRFSTTVTNTGSAITYTDSAANGASFTINETGVYYLSLSDNQNGLSVTGISLNSTELTTNINTITTADRLAMTTIVANNYNSDCSWTGVLEKGDVIRVHTDSSGAGTASRSTFTISKIGQKELAGVPLPIVGYVKDVRSSGTDGGTYTLGSYATRTLQTTEADFNKFGSLSSNQITLTAGTYDIEAEAVAHDTGTTKIKIYNTTDSSDAIIGDVARNDGSGDDFAKCSLKGRLTITSAKTYELRLRGTNTKTTSGMGKSAGFGDDEVYSIIKITKVI
ncbi:MAG: hypothetical protein GTN36_05475 [Candidatus Aenigmarchaeota archaeon]|nr:hypothetical protein [Candidatus Aenigmarchaeota archaeon]